jgi:hypothetical protein
VAATKDEHDNIHALATEAKECAEIVKKLHAVLRRPGSIAKMRAIRVNEKGQPVSTLPPPPDPTDK